MAAYFGAAWPVLAESSITRQPAASWVDDTPLPAPDPKYAGAVRDGLRSLLSEYQVRHRAGGYDVFDRYAHKIVDRSGLDSGAMVEWTFDPTRHKVSLNHLRIVRDGLIIDRSDTVPEVYRGETDAERGIFDGRLTARYNVEDVRVGDIIDYGRTVEVTPLVEAGLMSRTFSTEWSVPVSLARHRIVWPSNEPLTYKAFGTVAAPRVTIEGDMTSYLWEVTNPEPKPTEENVPLDFPNYSWVEVTNAKGWSSIVDRFVEGYSTDQPLPQGYEQRVAEIAAASSDPKVRLIAATRLIQDEIRYVSLSIGSGSYLPRSLTDIIRSGFGDCKDKALLLATVLRKLDIDAVVALTDLDEGRVLANRLPALGAFDHAIVKATIGGNAYWIDATDYLQGGSADTIVQADYGFALPIKAGVTELEAIPRPAKALPDASVVETFDFPRDATVPLDLAVETAYRGPDADRMRRSFARNSTEGIGRKYLEYYAERYPGIEAVRPVTFADDRESNEVRVSEAYRLSAENLRADDLIEDFPIRGDLNIGDLPEPTSVGRRSPVALKQKIFREHRVIVRNLKAEFNPPEDAGQLTPWFWLTAQSYTSPSTFVIDWRFMTLHLDRVMPEDLADYKKALDKALDDSYLRYNFGYVEGSDKADDKKT